MIIQCNKCQKQYKVNPEKITEQGTKITCPACGHQFIVRRKAEPPAPPEPKVKTPPCRVCGQPSTHVLQGDPPLTLCERCFQVEKEKKSRFFTEGSVPSAAKEETIPSSPKEAPLPTAPPTPSTEEPPPRKYVEGDYFDSFDEIPNLPSESEPLKSSPEPGIIRPETPAVPSPKSPETPLTDSLTGARFSLEQTADFEPAGSPSPAPAPLSDSAPTRVTDIPQKDTMPTTPLQPVPSPSSIGRLSLDEEVESDLERESQVQLPALAETEAPLPRTLQIKRRSPALRYGVVAGLLFALVLAAGFWWWFQQKNEAPMTATPAPPPVSAPIVEKPPAETPPSPPLDPVRQKQLQEKLELFREFFLRDTAEGYQKALKELEQALALAPETPEITALKIETYAFMTSHSNNFLYRRAMTKLIEQAPPQVQSEPAFRRAKIHQFLIEKDSRAARKALDPFVAEYPEDPIAYYLLAAALFQAEPPDYSAVLENLHTAVQLEPELTRAYWLSAAVYQAQKENEAAKAALRQVLKLSPQKTEARSALAKLEAAPKAKTQTPVQETPPTPAETVVPIAVVPPAPAAGQTVAALATPPPAEAPLALPAPVTTPAPPPPSGLTATGDALADNLREIISEVSRPMSRVPAPAQPPKTEPPPAEPPTKLIPPEERPPQ